MTIVQLNYLKENSENLTIRELESQTGLKKETIRTAIRRNNLVYKKEINHVKKPIADAPKLREFHAPVVQGKQLRVLEVAAALCEAPKSIHGLAIAVDVKTRTVYRYLTLLSQIGMEVKMDTSGRYYLDNCPFCKKKL